MAKTGHYATVSYMETSGLNLMIQNKEIHVSTNVDCEAFPEPKDHKTQGYIIKGSGLLAVFESTPDFLLDLANAMHTLGYDFVNVYAPEEHT